MHERACMRPHMSPLQVLALVTIAGAIFLHTALYSSLPTNTPRSDKTATSDRRHWHCALPCRVPNSLRGLCLGLLVC